MSFDLSHLLHGHIRELVVNQVTKQFGLSTETSGNLLTKGLSLVLGGMTQKAGSAEGAKGLFDFIKQSQIPDNALAQLTSKTENGENTLLEMGKNLLPHLFGQRADSVISHLAETTQSSPVAAKGVLGMVLPLALSFFKGKIAQGLGIGALVKLLGSHTQALSSYLDSASLSALGLSGTSASQLLSGVQSVSQSFGAGAISGVATGAGAGAATAAAVTATAKKSGYAKWAIPAICLLAALLGLKMCMTHSNNTVTSDQNAQSTPVQTAPQSPTTTESGHAMAEGLGNLGWSKNNDGLTLSGTVQNADIKAQLANAFKQVAGHLPFIDKLVVNADTPPFHIEKMAQLTELAQAFPDVNGAFADTVFNLSGKVANEGMKAQLVEKANALLGNAFTVNADAVSIAQATTNAATEANTTNATPSNPLAQPTATAATGTLGDMSADKLNLEIVFDSGSSNVNSHYHARLNAFAQFLIENNRRGEIAGYTDNVGNAAANQKLSEKRAKAVRDYLVKQGVPADHLTAVGYGEQHPIADNHTAEGRNKNRRIEFNVR